MPTTNEQKNKTAKVFKRSAIVLGAAAVALAIWSVVNLARGGSPVLIIVVLVLIVAVVGVGVAGQHMIK